MENGSTKVLIVVNSKNIHIPLQSKTKTTTKEEYKDNTTNFYLSKAMQSVQTKEWRITKLINLKEMNGMMLAILTV